MSDVQTIIAGSNLANTPAIATSTTALAANKARGAWMIQNLDHNGPLFVRLGAGATTSVFHVVLKAGTVDNDGTGGSFAQEEGVVWQGIVSVASAGTPSYTVAELTS